MYKLFFAALCALALLPRAHAQQFDFPEAAAQDSAVLSKTVTKLAIWALPTYKDADRETYLTNVSALQAAGGQYDEAVRTYGALRDFRRSAHISNPEWRDLQYEIYDRAKAATQKQKLPFDQAYQEAFRAAFAKLDDATSARAMPLFNIVDESWTEPTLQSELDAQKGMRSIGVVGRTLARD